MSDLTRRYLLRIPDSKPIDTTDRDYWSHIVIPKDKAEGILGILRGEKPFDEVFRDVSKLEGLGTPENLWSRLLPTPFGSGHVDVVERNGLTLLNYVLEGNEKAEVELKAKLEEKVGPLSQGLMYSNFGIGYEICNKKGIAKIPLGAVLDYLSTFSSLSIDGRDVNPKTLSDLVKRLNHVMSSDDPVISLKPKLEKDDSYQIKLGVVNLKPIVKETSRGPPNYVAVFDPSDKLHRYYFGQLKDTHEIPYLVMTLYRQDNVVGPRGFPFPETDPGRQEKMKSQRNTVKDIIEQALL